ncbi:MAG TPA: GDSL-type esterase/lipase family protein [Bryobacteraceae bacterium]|jgi:lysophospholipase L1-like esterase
MPWKTMLTIALFAGLVLLPQVIPALQNYKSLDLHNVPQVWDFPLPTGIKRVEKMTEEVRAKRLQIIAPKNLVDPGHELDHFYAALLKGHGARVVHYGDSPTTADLITADARAMLQKQFGDAGSGFVLIAKPWAWYGHRGVDMDSSKWKIDVAGDTKIKDGLHGLGAASFQGSVGAEAHWRIKDAGHRSVEISYLAEPDGGSFEFEADGEKIGEADTAAEQEAPGFASFEFPAGSKNFTLRVTRGSVRLYGADFRKAGPGVEYSSVGINGANITLLSHAMNGPHWAQQLQHYKPDLVVIAFGTNESGFPEFVDGTWGKELAAVVHRVQAAVPGASVLLMSPMDRGEKKTSGEIETIATLPREVRIETGVAKETGVAFFNTFQAMGGEGTMARWYASEPRLVGADYIHPMPGGAKIVGELLYSALRDGYNEYKLRQLEGRTDAPAEAPNSLEVAAPPQPGPAPEATKETRKEHRAKSRKSRAKDRTAKEPEPR